MSETSKAVPVYRLKRIPMSRPNAYEVWLGQRMVADLRASASRRKPGMMWRLTLDPSVAVEDRPAPFSEPIHEFATFPAAAVWLGLFR